MFAATVEDYISTYVIESIADFITFREGQENSAEPNQIQADRYRLILSRKSSFFYTAGILLENSPVLISYANKNICDYVYRGKKLCVVSV